MAIDLERAPYKLDLWNEFTYHTDFDLRVIFSKERDWSPIAGHNYHEMPAATFQFDLYRGKGILDGLRAATRLVWVIATWRPQLIFISGYVDRLPLLAIFLCIVTHTRYVVHSDVYNNQAPQGRFALLRLGIRTLIRSTIKRTGGVTLVCGKVGIRSAIEAGWRREQVYDFPYVVNVRRIIGDMPQEIPVACLADAKGGAPVILFSGRMIPRKGLTSLLRALHTLRGLRWTAWVEGDGPHLSEYRQLARELHLTQRCRFLGFCQMSLHSWLVRTANIVVVPSLEDPWAIVVDEGMQLRKAVITSDATGCGADRIRQGENGLVFAAGNRDELARALTELLQNPEAVQRLGDHAVLTAQNHGPAENAARLARIYAAWPE